MLLTKVAVTTPFVVEASKSCEQSKLSLSGGLQLSEVPRFQLTVSIERI
jgi:hypothetical protein